MKTGLSLAAALLMLGVIPLAAQEGPLQIYSAYPDEHMKALVDGFKAKYPAVDVQVSVQPGEQLLSTLELELRAGSPQADVVGLNQASIASLQEKHAAFAKYAPKGVEGVRQEVLDPSGASVPACVNLYLIQYNTNKITKADAPTAWTGLLDPKWKDQVALADPASSQSIHSFLWFMSEHLADKGDDYGWNFFKKLAANEPRLEKSHGTIRDMTASGERPIAIQLLANGQTSANRGDPTSLVWPSEGSPGEISSFAMFDKSDNKPAAQAWLDYLVTPEAQAMMPNALGCAPVRNDVDYKFPDGTAVGDVTIVPVDANFIADERESQIEKFNKAFGR
jgi:iron(III) transport system substrate-binding protein